MRSAVTSLWNLSRTTRSPGSAGGSSSCGTRLGGQWAPYRVDYSAARAWQMPVVPTTFPGVTVREVASTGWAAYARVAIDARRDPGHVEIVAVWVGMLGLDFHVVEPPELVERLRVLAACYAGAVPPDQPSGVPDGCANPVPSTQAPLRVRVCSRGTATSCRRTF